MSKMFLNKIKTAVVLLTICLGQIGAINAQNKKVERANEVYNKFAFIEASRLYKDLVDKGNTSLEVFTKLGNCYYLNGQYLEAADAYANVFNSGQSAEPEMYFRYAQALNNSGRYNEASKVIKKYFSVAGKKDSSEDWKEEKMMADIKRQEGQYDFRPVSINTPFSDYGTAFDGKDKVIFASAKDTGIVIKRKHSWNEKSFMKLYAANISTDGGLENPTQLKGDINTRYHQSSAAITKDGKYMYFTRNNYIDGKLGSDKEGVNYLKIYVAENVNGEWKKVKELPYPINSDGFSSAHPALNADDTQLYFASDRNNSFGNSDLYVVSLVKGMIANDVTKLSDEINTLGRETYPFVDGRGILYFASDGRPGFGGLDLFAAIKDENGKYRVSNLGESINSNADDFAFALNSESKKGYFSSNRSGNDDIYSVTENKPVTFDFEIRPTIFGTITEMGVPVADFDVKVMNSEDEIVGTAKTDANGKYSLLVDPYQNYKMLFSKPKYAQKTVEVVSLKPLMKKEVSFDILKEMEVLVDGQVVKIIDGDNLADKLKLNPIYFDLNGYNIRQSSKKELDKVVAVMKEHPHITVKVNSYTDSRGRDEYNMKLSQNRAKSTVEYIVNAGVAAERISGEGFGETNLLNNCSNGVVCSEKEHELNRRSEFIVSFK